MIAETAIPKDVGNLDNSDLYSALNALSGASVNSVPVTADTLKYVVIPSITGVAVSISAGANPTNGVFLLWDAAMRIDHVQPHGFCWPCAQQAATWCTSSSEPLTC